MFDDTVNVGGTGLVQHSPLSTTKSGRIYAKADIEQKPDENQRIEIDPHERISAIEKKMDFIIQLINAIKIRKSKHGSPDTSSASESGENATDKRERTANEKKSNTIGTRRKSRVKIESIKSSNSAENSANSKNNDKFAKKIKRDSFGS